MAGSCDREDRSGVRGSVVSELKLERFGDIVRFRGIEGEFIKETEKAVILFQPFNGDDGSYICIPKDKKKPRLLAIVDMKPLAGKWRSCCE